jgi:hypothetical protein
MTLVKFVFCQLVPVVAAYWTDQVLRSTALVPALNNSIKSFLKVVPVLPPPP